MRRLITLNLVAAAIAAFALSGASGASALTPGAAAPVAHPASAGAEPNALVPPGRGVLTGVSSGSPAQFGAEVGKHPAIYGEFVTWGESIHFAFDHAAAAHATLMLHISTTAGFGARQAITPGGIVAGAGDPYLLGLAKLTASHHKPIYIRLFPEMNNANNAYSAYNMDGSARGADYSAQTFIAAWRRVVTILRGGAVAAIDQQLAALGQTRVHGTVRSASIPQTPISFVWTPETAGTPAIAGNDPANYYPGDAYVDWVGTDFYSRFPNFPGLDAFYKQYSSKPFAFGEWALWGADNPSFVSELFKWVSSHHRVRMMLYNQGYTDSGPFSLTQYPASRRVIRAELAPSYFLAYTAAW
ncbi:MAG TPA: hypothetical protein VHX66_10340 [Solirubrobacteraceae bacterium]|nr:hypothetical protein [Solirubrobacteraceae bacterium]